MARQKGLLKVEGTLDNLTFYKTKDGHLVKTKGGISGERIANDPAFVRTRENGAEFATSASSGKLLRDSLRSMAMNASDPRIVSRLMQLMAKIKNLDATSARGQRNVGVGVATAAAKALLKGFEFNKSALLGSILFKPAVVVPATGVITITGLLPANDIVWPSGATHMSISGASANINFATSIVDVKQTNIQNLALNAAASTVTLTPTSVPAGTGTKLFLLKVEFFQQVNGTQYSLKNGAYNALRVIEVA